MKKILLKKKKKFKWSFIRQFNKELIEKKIIPINLTLKKNDIDLEIKKMKINLILNKIKKEEILGFFQKKIKIIKTSKFDFLKKQVTKKNENFFLLKEIKYILYKFPFFLNEKDSLKISRYITEDNLKERVNFNENFKIEKIMFFAIFKNLIINYKLLNKKVIFEKFLILKKQFLVRKSFFFYIIKQKFGNLPQFLSIKNLNEILIFSKIQLFEEDFIVIFISLFYLSNNFDKLPYEKLFLI